MTDETICVKAEPPDNSFNNCIIGCTPGYPTGGGSPLGPGGAGGGCLRNPDDCVAYQGKAEAGKPCTAGGGAVSAPVGMPMGGPDTGTGPNGNEVNNVFLINVYSGSGAGAIQGNGGFLLTTFSGHVWYQPPISLPIYNGAIYINMGNISVANNGQMGFSTLENSISSALSSPQNSGLSGVVKNGVSAFLSNLAKQGTNAATPDCFSGGAWDGKTTS